MAVFGILRYFDHGEVRIEESGMAPVRQQVPATRPYGLAGEVERYALVLEQFSVRIPDIRFELCQQGMQFRFYFVFAACVNSIDRVQIIYLPDNLMHEHIIAYTNDTLSFLL